MAFLNSFKLHLSFLNKGKKSKLLCGFYNKFLEQVVKVDFLGKTMVFHFGTCQAAANLFTSTINSQIRS